MKWHLVIYIPYRLIITFRLRGNKSYNNSKWQHPTNVMYMYMRTVQPANEYNQGLYTPSSVPM